MQNKLNYNKKEKILIGVTITSLLMIFIGMGYAYFTANNPQGSTAEVISETGKMVITYNDGTDNIVPVTGIQPSNNIIVDKTFTLTGTNTAVGINAGDGLTMPYKVGIEYTSGFSDGMLHYYIKSTSKGAGITEVYTGESNQTVPGNDTYTGYYHGTFKKGNKYTEMVTGEFPASLNDQTITFNLIIQFPDNNENQDTEKGKSFNGKIVINKEYSFASDSWSKIAQNIRSGKANLYEIGEEKDLEIDGTNYTVRVANNSTPTECSGTDFSQTACGFVIEFADIIGEENIGGGTWHDSQLKTYLNSTFYDKLPSDLKSVIISTKVFYSQNPSTEYSTSNKIYLLSPREIWGNIPSESLGYNNSRQLDYYNNLGITVSNYAGAIKKYNNTNSQWWLRYIYNSNYTLALLSNIIAGPSGNGFFVVTPSGSVGYEYSDYPQGVSPAFRIG